MPITMQDVARKANVSKTAVSAVVGRFGKVTRVRVGEATRQRIIAAANELGYSTNILASGLRKGKTQTIGVILEHLSGETNTLRARAVEDLAREHGYRVFFCCHNSRGELEEADVRDLVARRVDGLIVSPVFRAADEGSPHLQGLAEKRFPLVTFYDRLPFPVNSVTVDNVYGGLLVVRHLIEIGRKKLAFIGGNPVYQAIRDRFTGWREGCREAGLDFEAMPFLKFISGSSEEAVGYQLCRTLIRDGRKFDALVTSNDHLALGSLKALQDAGVRIPEDAAVAGYDDNRFAEFLSIPLTTVRQPAKEVGEAAFQILLRKMEAPESPLETIVLKPSLVVRQSTMI